MKGLYGRFMGRGGDNNDTNDTVVDGRGAAFMVVVADSDYNYCNNPSKKKQHDRQQLSTK